MISYAVSSVANASVPDAAGVDRRGELPEEGDSGVGVVLDPHIKLIWSLCRSSFV